ncbi:MAG: peptidase C15, partial [Beijerinckiaceae bacterium]|nr:peptidase C15 [Beijerinckiaceae bacterium]
WPSARLRAALARAGHDARRSIDAGDYVCNATLYRSLAAGLAPRVGFLHVPRPGGRLTLDAMTEAALALILEMTRAALPRRESSR